MKKCVAFFVCVFDFVECVEVKVENVSGNLGFWKSNLETLLWNLCSSD